MPWAPELFSAPTLARLQEERRQRLVTVPYFDGLMAGEPDALVGSFAGMPELHDPIRGRVKGAAAFAAYVSETNSWLSQHRADVEEIGSVHTERRSFGEFVLQLDGQNARVDLQVAIVADRRPDRRIEELRLYFSSWPLTGRHAIRPPLLQPDPELRVPDVVGDYQRAFAAGDIEAVVAAFEPDGYAREPGSEHVHEGPDGLRAFYELAFSNGGGVPLEHCAIVDDGRACALEYNVVRWGRTELPPQAGVSVYVRGQASKLAAARIYEDAAPPFAALA